MEITWYEQYTKTTGAIEEQERPCFSNNFLVLPSGKLVFDAPASKEAKSELAIMLNARGLECRIDALMFGRG